MEDEDSRHAMTHEQAVASQRTADNTAGVVGLVLFAACCGVAYWIWPDGITDLTLAAITFGQLLRAIASGVAVLIGIALCMMFFN